MPSPAVAVLAVADDDGGDSSSSDAAVMIAVDLLHLESEGGVEGDSRLLLLLPPAPFPPLREMGRLLRLE